MFNETFSVFMEKSVSDLLDTDLKIIIAKDDIVDKMETDPRQNFQRMNKSNQIEFLPKNRFDEILRTDQATVMERKQASRQMTLKILNGQPPDRLQLDETYANGACTHFMKVNDVLSESVNTYLARMMDSGIVDKILRNYDLSDGMYYMKLTF